MVMTDGDTTAVDLARRNRDINLHVPSMAVVEPTKLLWYEFENMSSMI